jgi:hypothetical protein
MAHSLTFSHAVVDVVATGDRFLIKGADLLNISIRAKNKNHETEQAPHSVQTEQATHSVQTEQATQRRSKARK